MLSGSKVCSISLQAVRVVSIHCWQFALTPVQACYTLSVALKQLVHIDN